MWAPASCGDSCEPLLAPAAVAASGESVLRPSSGTFAVTLYVALLAAALTAAVGAGLVSTRTPPFRGLAAGPHGQTGRANVPVRSTG